MKEITVRNFNSATSERFREILRGPADEAARWLYTAAEHGVVEAQAHYGQMLLDGNGVKKNPQEAFQWFKLAANEGNVMAMNMTGRCYENGWGVQADMLLATYWFKLAAHAGLDWGMYNYATSLALGRGIETDRGEALAWLRKAAAMGHSKSWNLLGGFHEDGWEVDKEMDIAFDCYRKAAQGGDFRGQFNYARLLAARGSPSEAVKWMARAELNATDAFRNKLRQFLAHSSVREFKKLLQYGGSHDDRDSRYAESAGTGTHTCPP